MTDDKPMTFEDHAHGLHLYGCGCKNGDRTACLSAIERMRAAHQREVEAARREEREACADLAGQWRYDIPAQWSIEARHARANAAAEIEDAILARGKQE